MIFIASITGANEATRWGFCSTSSHVSTSKSLPEANRATLTFGGSKVEVGACHDRFSDSLAMDTAEA